MLNQTNEKEQRIIKWEITTNTSFFLHFMTNDFNSCLLIFQFNLTYSLVHNVIHEMRRYALYVWSRQNQRRSKVHASESEIKRLPFEWTLLPRGYEPKKKKLIKS